MNAQNQLTVPNNSANSHPYDEGDLNMVRGGAEDLQALPSSMEATEVEDPGAIDDAKVAFYCLAQENIKRGPGLSTWHSLAPQ